MFIQWCTRRSNVVDDDLNSVEYADFIFPIFLRKVCAVEPLVFDEEHPLRSQCIVAMATLSKFFVITIRPRLKVIKFQPLQGSSDTLPLISWQLVVIQSADSSRVTDPVLAVGRGPNIFFHQVSTNKISPTLAHIIFNKLFEIQPIPHWLDVHSIR